MNLSHRELQILLLLDFRLGRRATKTTHNIYSTMDENVLYIRTGQHWFNHFRNGNLELDDLPRSRRSLKLYVDLLQQLIEKDPLRLTSRHLGE